MIDTHPLAKDLNSITEQGGSIWNDLRGARIFLTGGTGFFGCWLLESLLWASDQLGLSVEIVVLTRRPDQFQRKAPHLAGHRAVRLHLGDIRTFDPPDGSFSHLIHAATDASAALNLEQPRLMFDTIVDGTRRVLDVAAAQGIRNLLFTSSGAVYGRQPAGLLRVDETYPGGPDLMSSSAAYAEGKRAAEFLCALYARHHGLEPRIARCFAFVGPYLPLDIHYAVGNFIRDGMAGKPIIIQGDGTPFRSYLYAADMAVWLWTILVRGKACHPYNVGSDEAVSIADLARTVASRFSPAIPVEIRKPPTPGQLAERYVPSVDRARQALGLDVRVNLPEALDRTIVWARGRSQPEA